MSISNGDFNTLSDIIDEIEKGLGEIDQIKLKKILVDEARKNKLDTHIISYLTDETELSHFVRAFKDALNIQICFLIDTTASMSAHYENFKNQVFGSIMEGLLSAVNQGEKRYAFLGYRERNEEHEFVQFTHELDEIRRAIREAKPRGGGDAAEDVEHALKLFVENISFKKKGTRIIIHVADAHVMVRGIMAMRLVMTTRSGRVRYHAC